MSAGAALDLRTCELEPIHIPGCIQPHGFLLVVDPNSDQILQAAGITNSFITPNESVVGNTVQRVIGLSLSNLIQREDAVLLREPIFLGTVGPFGDRELTLTAHLVQGVVVVEAEPANIPVSAAKTLATIRSITERIGEASSLIEACEIAAHEVKRITRYDRVMIYRFLPDGSGSVIAEVKEAQLPPFLNHHFPASDIPKQALELYRRSAIRLIPDVGYIPEPLAPAVVPSTNRPLDMSYCVLRSVSPVHLQYLKNMEVGASMSVSLLPQGELWGLIACHNTTPRSLSYEAKETCTHVGQILSQQIQAREEAENYRIAVELGAARDRAMRALVDAEDPGRTLLDLGQEVKAFVDAHGVVICRKGVLATAGRCLAEYQIRHLLAWLDVRMQDNDFFVTDRLPEEYPEARSFAEQASGVLAVRLPSEDQTTLVWLRAEHLQEINWAGNPHEPVAPSSRMGALNPRKSFATWQEKVRGRSRPWRKIEIESVQWFSPRAAFVIQQRNVRELNHLLAAANDRLAALAATDGLTGIPNRRAFDERLKSEWTRANRSLRPLAIIILDLDLFKQYNDHYGHISGDDCLKQVAQCLQIGRRANDLAARIGGEEFALLLPDTDIDGAATVAEALRSRIQGLLIPHAQNPGRVVTASFGVAAAANAGTDSAETLMKAADLALYNAKESGRNRVAISISD